MSTIKNEQKHCQHLTPYRLHSISQNFEEAEQLLCSVGGNRCFGTGEKCKSTAAQTRVVCTVKLYQVDISDPIPASGAASSPCTMKRPRCFSAALGSHTTPKDNSLWREWAWLQHCLPGKLFKLSHQGALGFRRSKGNMLH